MFRYSRIFNHGKNLVKSFGSSQNSTQCSSIRCYRFTRSTICRAQRLHNHRSLEFPTNVGSAICVGGGIIFLSIASLKCVSETKAAEKEETAVEEEAVVQEEEDAESKDEDQPLPAIPSTTQYLLIGGGTASYSAMRAIRKRDPTAQVLIITHEDSIPYMRPPLSKELWFSDDQEAARRFQFKAWNGKWRSIYFDDESFYVDPSVLPTQPSGGVAVVKGKKVVKISPNNNSVTLDDGTEVKFEKCLIATGGSPKNLSIFETAEETVKSKTTLFRNASDFLTLDSATENIESVTVIGGGFLGSELACALGYKGAKSGFKVHQIFPEAGNMGRVLPEYLTKWTTEKVRKEGIEVHPEVIVSDVTQDGSKVKLTLGNGEEISTDHVVVAVGLDIDTSLAESAGIEVDEKQGGYRVNAELQGRSNIWVAGDASCFYDIKLGRRRVEHHDHAVVSGRLAGENMTGAGKPYWHQSMFWSDLGPDVGYEAVGIVDSTLPTVGVFAKATERDTPKAAAEETGEGIRSEQESSEQQPSADSKMSATAAAASEEFGKGVIFYLKENKVVGVLLWNVFGRTGVARKLIRDQQEYEDFSEVAKLFKIHSEEFE